MLIVTSVTGLEFRRLDPCGLRLLYATKKLSKPRTTERKAKETREQENSRERKSLENALCIANLDAYK